MAEHDLVDIGGPNARIAKGLVGDLDHQAFDGLGVEFAKGRMRPSDDAGCHSLSPVRRSSGELTTQFVVDVNPDNVVECFFGGRKSQFQRPLRIEIARPSRDNPDNKRVRLALDARGDLVASDAFKRSYLFADGCGNAG